jgi:hypothetical protein
MVNEGIVIGHKISERGIEVDRAKVEAIEKMPCPRDVKGIRSILDHAGFYRRFIKDFSKISKPLTNLLQKDVPFVFDDDCKEAFETLKKALTTAPIVQPPDWNLPFQIMCNASDFLLLVLFDAGKITTQLGTPRGRYDEYNSKFSLSKKPRFIVSRKKPNSKR